MKYLNLNAYRGTMKSSRESGVFHCLQTAIVNRTSETLDKLKAKVDYGFLWLKMIKRRYIDKQKILERDHYVCAYCYGDATEVEHVVPWNWTHNNDEDNLVASCHECNSIAGGRIFSSFDEKRAYVLVVRSGRKWTKKLAIKYQVFRCSDCKTVFIPLKDGATNFLCPECTRKEYAE